MPKISKRAEAVPASPIRKLVPYSDAAKARGTHVYHLNIGQPDLETPAPFWETIQNSSLTTLAYGPSAGLLPLRESIQHYYERLGLKLDISNIQITTGASEALRIVLGSCMNAGDSLIVPEPFYANYNSFALQEDIQIKPITTRIEEGFDLPDVQAFQEWISADTRAILLCNPGNPTGTLYPREALEALGKLAKEHDLFLIVDEVYREFVYGGQTHFSALDLEGLEEHVVVIDSISKRFSACGARVGAVISRNAALMAAVLKYAQARLCPPTLAQLGAVALYQLPASYYKESIAIYAARRDLLLELLNNIPGVYSPKVNGAFYVIARLPVEDAEHFCQWILSDFSHEDQTVMMAPAAGFYATDGLGKQEVRIAYVLQEKDLKKAMECLEVALEEYPGKKV